MNGRLCYRVVTEEEPAAESNAEPPSTQPEVKMFISTLSLSHGLLKVHNDQQRMYWKTQVKF